MKRRRLFSPRMTLARVTFDRVQVGGKRSLKFRLSVFDGGGTHLPDTYIYIQIVNSTASRCTLCVCIYRYIYGYCVVCMQCIVVATIIRVRSTVFIALGLCVFFRPGESLGFGVQSMLSFLTIYTPRRPI